MKIINTKEKLRCGCTVDNGEILIPCKQKKIYDNCYGRMSPKRFRRKTGKHEQAFFDYKDRLNERMKNV